MIAPHLDSGGVRVHVTVVIPAFQAQDTIVSVATSLPAWVTKIIIVDDGSSDSTVTRVEAIATGDHRIELIRHGVNRGVSDAMTTGMLRALEVGAQIVVKMDSDGQMSPHDLPALLAPVLAGRADCAKGNRFQHAEALKAMPFARWLGNWGLSWICKPVTGYWHLFDPTNGFLAVRAEVLGKIVLARLRGYYLFEIALLVELSRVGAVVRDVPLPARYGSGRSSLSLCRALLEFPPRLSWLLIRRCILDRLSSPTHQVPPFGCNRRCDSQHARAMGW